MSKFEENQITENLKLIEEGKPLNMPLSILNGKFKEKYFVCLKCKVPISEGNLSGYCRKCSSQSEEVKKRKREYYQKPEAKKKAREYYQKPEVKKRVREYKREYNQKPEVKKKRREYLRKKYKIPKSKWRVKD